MQRIERRNGERWVVMLTAKMFLTAGYARWVAAVLLSTTVSVQHRLLVLPREICEKVFEDVILK
jgi:hypothetical protein